LVVSRTQGPIGTPVTPAANDRGNSTGGTNTVTKVAKGEYEVLLGGMGDGFGTVQVTPVNTSPRWCSVDEWGPDTGGVRVTVLCKDASGSLVNSGFVLSYVEDTGLGHGATGRRLAYMWNSDAVGAGSQTPNLLYQSTSAGTTITRNRTSTGRYTVTIPGMGVTGGNVQLTSVASLGTCRAVSWSGTVLDETVTVACNKPAGTPVDAQFDLLFLHRLGPEGWGGGPSAYLLANKPNATSYTPTATHRFNTKGKAMSILRGGTGNYTVILSGMPAGGAALVTAFGSGTAHCQLSSLGTVTPMKAIVRCFTPTGAATNAKFSLAYTK
jgi:hypothetical protein